MDAWDSHRWVYSGEMQNLLNLLTFTAWCKESMIRIVFGKVFHLFKRAQLKTNIILWNYFVYLFAQMLI